MEPAWNPATTKVGALQNHTHSVTFSIAIPVHGTGAALRLQPTGTACAAALSGDR